MEWFENFMANLANNKYYQAVLAAVCTVMLLGFFLLLKVFCSGSIRGKVAEVKELVGVGTGKPRFRKRDKMLFYGRKMLRKVKSLSSQGKSVGDRFRSKKRQMVIKFAKKLLQLRKEQQPLQLQVKEPPPAYLEPDLSDSAEHLLPPEVLYMLKSLRIFGPFDKPFFLELYKRMESRFVYAGHYVFRIGDDDDSIYVVQSGRLTVFLVEQDGTELILKSVSQGESVTSFLSFIDVLVGKPSVFKTVCARAEVDTIILKLPLGAFVNLFHRYPEYLVRVVQIIMVRLHRVSFTALYQYLGLTSQLINPTSQYRRMFSAPHPTPSYSPKPSPSRSKDKFSSSQAPGISASYEDKLSFAVPVADDSGGFNESYEMTSSSLPSDSDVGHSHHLHFSESSKDYVASSELLPRKRRPVSEMSDHIVADSLDEKDYMQKALNGFSTNLGLNDESILVGRVELREVVSGTYLIKQESLQDAALIYTLTGCLVVSQRVIDKNQETTLYLAYPGEIVGGLAVVSGEPSFFTVRAKQPSRVAIINKLNFYTVMREQPGIVLHAANSIVCRLSQFVRQIDFSLDWTHIESGKPLYRQDEPSHSMYIVLSGRLRSVITLAGGKKELVGEYGKGDLVGLVELLTQTLRSTSVIAVRDTELAVMPEGLLNTIKIKFPVVVTRLVHLLGHRILGSWQRGHPVDQYPSCSSASSFATVAILPLNNDVPVSQFTLELHHSLSAIGPALRLTSEYIRKTLGPKSFDRPNEFRLTSWLGQQEDHHKCVLYQCDSELTAWTLRCIRQADVILIIALADQEPTVGKIEKQLESLAVRTQKDLILLHKEDAPRPQNTVQWLNIRSWCSSFHHICCPKRMFTKRSSFKMKELYKKLFQSEPSVHSDFSRLARFLTGTSIGLVLGGGGARGCAHVGMIRAIMEAGIPIDTVGGVSIGAFMGALWCMEKSVTTFTQRAREWALKMTSVWRQILDLTYPSTAMFTGAAFNRAIKEVFRDTQIEDLWLPYFTITTDITNSCMRIHTHGSLWRYVRSSMSLSGYLPPLCDPTDGHLLLDGGYVNNLPGSLWRYVRASMSICGLFPPLCDPEDGHLLVDGAYVHNLPADVMRTMGVHQILAIDVGSQDDTDLTNYGDELSGWWLLWKRWNPWTRPIRVPNLPEIQSRLAYVSCVRQLEEVKRHDYCIYIRPPIDNYKTLQFGSFDEIRDVGYSFGKAYFENMQRLGNLPGRLKTDRFQSPPEHVRVTSFTDLAEMVCRIQEPSRSSVLSECSDEDEVDDDVREDGYVSEPATVLNTSERRPYERTSSLRRRNTSTDLTEFE